MADGADLELQAAMKAHLVADSTITALLGTPPRLYQDVPSPPTFPYATLGETQESDDSSSCQAASDIYADIHVWSREPGFEQIKRIASAIRLSLHDAELTLASERCVLIEHKVTRHFRDGEGPVKHSVVTFHANIEEL